MNKKNYRAYFDAFQTIIYRTVTYVMVSTIDCYIQRTGTNCERFTTT